MRYIPIDKAESGMVLAQSVFDESDRVLLGARNTLTDEFIRKLEFRGFQGVYIDDELSKGIDIQEIIPVNLRNHGVRCLRECNIDEALEVAKDIVQQILESHTISLDLVDLRTFDDYTYRHSVNVAVLSTVIGMGLNFKKSDLVDLCVAAIFHDLGKLRINPAILNKPSVLTTEEYEIMKEHSKLSYELIKERKDVSARSKVGVLFHHENEDGSGYPRGLEKNDIHLFAKIIHVADVYDALTSKRPYKNPYEVSEVIEYLMGGCDILFDRNVVEVFMKSVPVFPKGMGIMLSDGRSGIVLENTDNPIRPRVRLMDGKELDLSLLEYRNITITALAEEPEADFSDETARRLQRLQNKKKHIIIGSPKEGEIIILRSILKEKYKLSEIKTGEAVLEYLCSKKLPDLIIIETELPDMGGLEVVKKIRSHWSEHIPVILIASCVDKETLAEFRELKAKNYILRPLKPVFIQECVENALKEKAETTEE